MKRIYLVLTFFALLMGLSGCAVRGSQRGYIISDATTATHEEAALIE